MRICRNSLSRIAEYARAGRVVVVDTETTGCSRDDQICQLAAAEYVAGRLTRTMNVYVRPTCEMSYWAERIHGISMEYLDEHGIEPTDALGRFFDFLGSDALFVAHNVPFDKGMIERECQKFGFVCEPRGIETCDTVHLARVLVPGLGSYSLGDLLKPLGLTDVVNSHDALDDVMACAGVFFKLLRED
ncbi:MAG: exonuclease domain-containing protein [Kiritimatiellia bacterium]